MQEGGDQAKSSWWLDGSAYVAETVNSGIVYVSVASPALQCLIYRAGVHEITEGAPRAVTPAF